MQSSYWGYWLVVMGVAIVGLMISVQGITTNTTQDRYAIREITDAAMLEAVDYAYYRDYNEVKINKEKFMEVFLRMTAEVMGVNDTYEVNFYAIYEAPPKVSVEIRSNSGTNFISSGEYDTTSRIDAIIQIFAEQEGTIVDDPTVDPDPEDPGTTDPDPDNPGTIDPDPGEDDPPLSEDVCDTTGLDLDTTLSGVYGVTFGSGENQGRYGILYSDQALSTQVERMTPGTIFTISGSASGDDTRWYINYEGECGWVDGSNLGIDFGGYASKIGARVQMNITNKTASIFRTYGHEINNVTGRALYSSVMTIDPLQYNFAKIVGNAALNANAGGDTLIIYETYRPQSVSNQASDYFEETVLGNLEIANEFRANNVSVPGGLSVFLAGNSSQHNRGCAVDASLAGKEDMMPSNMHELSTLARGNNSYSATLRGYFTSAGARTIGSEWWHFDYGTGVTGTCINVYSDFWGAM